MQIEIGDNLTAAIMMVAACVMFWALVWLPWASLGWTRAGAGTFGLDSDIR